MSEPVCLRVIKHGQASPFYNMAVDEAISVLCEENNFVPVLRFYEWHPHSVSIGYFQKVKEIQQKLPTEKKYTIVRRPTGGGTVVHDEDITFSLTVAEKFFCGPVINSYNIINESIINSIDVDDKSMLGLLKSKKSPQSSASSRFCFREPSKYDILWGDRKVGGSAQRRKNKIVLHQSSFFYRKIIENSCNERSSLKSDFEQMITNGISRMLNLPPSKSELLENEVSSAEELFAAKYSLDKWNFMR